MLPKQLLGGRLRVSHMFGIIFGLLANIWDQRSLISEPISAHVLTKAHNGHTACSLL